MMNKEYIGGHYFSANDVGHSSDTALFSSGSRDNSGQGGRHLSVSPLYPDTLRRVLTLFVVRRIVPSKWDNADKVYLTDEKNNK